jgi:hypothetical protein
VGETSLAKTVSFWKKTVAYFPHTGLIQGLLISYKTPVDMQDKDHVEIPLTGVSKTFLFPQQL